MVTCCIELLNWQLPFGDVNSASTQTSDMPFASLTLTGTSKVYLFPFFWRKVPALVFVPPVCEPGLILTAGSP